MAKYVSWRVYAVIKYNRWEKCTSIGMDRKRRFNTALVLELILLYEQGEQCKWHRKIILNILILAEAGVARKRAGMLWTFPV